MPHENPLELAAIAATAEQQYAPRDQIERELIIEIVQVLWMLRRLRAYEAQRGEIRLQALIAERNQNRAERELMKRQGLDVPDLPAYVNPDDDALSRIAGVDKEQGIAKVEKVAGMCHRRLRSAMKELALHRKIVAGETDVAAL